METKTELYKAIANVMKDVKGIDKSMTVGEGRNAYKAVSDKDVKLTIGAAMQEHGLIMLPKSYDTNLTVDRWEQTDNYGTKMKQSVFVEAKCVYELIHVESGQSVDIPAYGHGIDTQDKAAGKATTYAMKTALLYAFLVPTGAIDDTDKEHSDNKPVPQPKAPAKPQPKAKSDFKPQGYEKAIKAVLEGKMTAQSIIDAYNVTPEQVKQLNEAEAMKGGVNG
jgi:hypothetical protein